MTAAPANLAPKVTGSGALESLEKSGISAMMARISLIYRAKDLPQRRRNKTLRHRPEGRCYKVEGA